MKWLFVAGALASIASVSSAQVRCTKWGNVTQCNDTRIQVPNSGPVDYAGRLGIPQSTPQFSHRQMLYNQMNRMVEQGQCVEAVYLALDHNDLELAKRAKAYCQR